MVRVWFGNESDGLKRDRQDYTLTIIRKAADLDEVKRFYCEGLGFYVTGVTTNQEGRTLYCANERLASIAFGFRKTDEPVEGSHDGLHFEIGIWREDNWQEIIDRMAELGFTPAAQKLSNPHQKWLEYSDETGIVIRVTYTRPPVTTTRMDPNTRSFDD